MGQIALSSGPLTDGRSFFNGANGRWAGERFTAAMKAGRPITPDELRTADVLRKEEWLFFDNELILEAQIRLRGVADLIAAGLVRRIPNGLAKTVFEWQKVTDMDPATVSLDGVTRSENDRVEFDLESLPLPITHKDFYINLRALMASRSEGFEALDTTHVRVAGRKVAETTEDMLFNGGKTFGSRPIYGYTTHPDRETASFGSGGAWSGSKTGEQKLTDLQTMMTRMEANRMFGPYVLYTGKDASIGLGSDFKAASDKSTKERLLELDNLSDIRVSDVLADGNLLLVQMTSDVVQMIEGEPLQTVQWDVHGGFQINFKAFQIMVPLIRSDADGRSGIVHMSA